MGENIKTNWKIKPLSEVVTLQRGYDLPQYERIHGDVPVYGSFGITGYHNKAKAKGPGVTIGRSGASFGVVNYSPVDYWPHNAVLFVTNFHGNDERFIYYLFRNFDFSHLNSGSAQPSLNRNYVYLEQLGIPPLPTQRKIAAVLSAYDDMIENNLRRIKILEEMAQNLYREWFVNFRFPGHEKVKMVDSPLGRIPEGWEVKSATDALFVNPPVSVSKDSNKAYVAMEGLSNTSMLINVTGYRQEANGSKYKNGDTLFARITPCLENGKTGFVQFLSSDSESGIGSTEFIVLRSKTLPPEYVYFMARSDNFRENAIKSMSGASGRQRVQNEAFKKYKFAHPDKGCLTRFSEMVSPMFKLIHQFSKKNVNLRQTRDILLPKLISGELDVSDLDIKVEDAK